MNEFFQAVSGLPGDRDNRTVIGIDGAFSGEKAVLSDGKVIYRTAGLSEELLLLAQEAEQAGQGLLPTARGRIFLEQLGCEKKIILCGGGHVSSAVLAVAGLLEFSVTVIEDRPAFARLAGASGAKQVICEEFNKALESIKTDRDTYIVIMTRGHRHDLDCLRAVLSKEYAYLGMMGSRGRVAGVRRQLLEEGFPPERIEKLHAPIGLPIGAVTPGEIAVSVMAEIVKFKAEEKREPCYEKEVRSWLFDPGEKKPAVLATIVDRKGSAPRQVGTRMLIFADGSTIGTIGGGCMEAEVTGIARHMLAEASGTHYGSEAAKRYGPGDAGNSRTCFVDMSGRDAEEEGMVCGGTLEIFLEIL